MWIRLVPFPSGRHAKAVTGTSAGSTDHTRCHDNLFRATYINNDRNHINYLRMLTEWSENASAITSILGDHCISITYPPVDFSALCLKDNLDSLSSSDSIYIFHVGRTSGISVYSSIFESLCRLFILEVLPRSTKSFLLHSTSSPVDRIKV